MKNISLIAGVDFKSMSSCEHLQIGDSVLIKQSIATGWAKLAKVKRVLKSQIEVEIINVITTVDSNRFGIKDGFKDINNRSQSFFANWAFRKKFNIGKKEKFFIESCIRVGDSNSWNPTCINELTNS